MSAEKQVLKAGPLAEIIPDAVRVGDEVHLSGVISIDEEMNPVAAGDFLGQMRQCYANIEAVLEGLDADLSNLVQETLYVTDIAAARGSEDAPWEAFAEARADCFGGYPEVAQSLIGVAELVFPEAMIEIEAVARL